MDVLGVRIGNLTKKEILEKIEFFLTEEKPCLPAGRFHQIATVNPEFVLRAQKDENFKRILNGCDLNVADGVGIFYAFLRHFEFLKSRLAGVDLMQEVLQIANEKSLHLFLAIHPGGLSRYEDVKNALGEKFPNIKIGGGEIDPKKDKKWPEIKGYQLVFCNFGFPRQEQFLNSAKNDTIRLAMGVGGSFDFATGKVKRAPKWMRILGLEWLWRLVLEPRYRFKRIFNAVFVFPTMVIFKK